MEAPAQSIAFFQSKPLKIAYAVIFSNEGKSYASFGAVKGLLFVHSQYQQNVVLL